MGLSIAQSHAAGHHHAPVRNCRACRETAFKMLERVADQAGAGHDTGAFTPARDPAPSLRRGDKVTARTIRPQLESIARRLSAEQLARTRWETVPGDRVAVYRLRGSSTIRILLTGPERLLTIPPATLEDGQWVRIAQVEITDDGEQALAEGVS